MRLVNISLPSNQYVFSNEYQNTKFNFTVDVSGEVRYIPTSRQLTKVPIHLTNLAQEVQNKMNAAIVVKGAPAQ